MKFLESLAKQFTGKPVDWDELEESLIRADLGVPMTLRIIKTLQEREAWALLGIGDVIKAVRAEIARILPSRSAQIRSANGKPTVILIVGVNGTGKTTSTAKLAHYLRRDRQSVTLAAADTFRAAAIGQLDVWVKWSAANTAPTRLRFVTTLISLRRRTTSTFCFATPLGVNTPKRTSWPSCK